MLLNKKVYNFSKINELLISCFVVSFSFAFLDFVGVLYLSHFGFKDIIIGYILVGFSIFSIVLNLVISPFLERFDEYKLYLSSLYILGLLYLLVFFFSDNYILYLLIASLSIFTATLNDNSFGIVFRDISPKKSFEKNESLLYGVSNIAWFISPLVGGLILENYGFKIVFLIISLIFFFGAILSSFFKIKDFKKREKLDINFLLNIKDYFKNKEISKAYLYCFVTSFHYSFIFVYVVLEIEKNYGIFYSGLFFALTQLPLIFIQVKMNYFLKKFNIKNLIKYNLLLLSVVYILCFFINDFFIKIIVLLFSALSLSFLEPLRETYFFENTNKLDEEKFYPIFLTAFSIGGILSKIIISTILIFLSLNYIFFLIFLICAGTTYIAFKK